MEVVLASGNEGKRREIEALLADTGVRVVAQSSFGVPPVAETASTFVENALIKARHAARHCARPALADDSGLVVDALGGAPGVRSARYAGEGASDESNVRKLLAELAGVPQPARIARFACVMVLVRAPDEPLPLVAEGVWNGSILDAPRGRGGFGYDPVFLVPGLRRSAAELDPADKNRLSHRGQALRALHERLEAGL